jgi:Tfp pilus assembly protein PilP
MLKKVVPVQKNSIWIFVFLLVFCGQSFCAETKKPAAAETKKAAAEPKKPAAVEPTKEAAPKPPYDAGNFTYTSTNRRDPFEQLHVTKQKENKGKTSLKKGYELEELKVVGVLRADKDKFVMMEDMQGRGMLFKKGDFINTNLWVVDVLENQIALGYKLKGELRRILLNIPRQ